MDDEQVWAAVDARRSTLVDLLSGVGEDDWQVTSLCPEWTVKDVAAHLTMPSLGIRAMVGLALRHPGSTNTLIRDGSKDLSRRQSADQIIEGLRAMIGYHHHFPTLTCREALIDVLGHSLDIAIPLAAAGSVPAAQVASGLPPDQVAEAANHVLSYRGGRNSKVFHPVPLDGLLLRATDHPWTSGAGLEVRGTMTDLFLLLIGRMVHLDRLDGPGASAVRSAGQKA